MGSLGFSAGVFLIHLTCFFETSLVGGSRANYSLDINSLDKLAESDLRIVQSLLDSKGKLGTGSSLHKIIDKYLKDFEDGTGIALQNWTQSEEWKEKRALEISGNAIAAYRLIQRYGKLLPKLIKKVNKERTANSELGHDDFPLKDVEILEFPDEQDFNDAWRGMLRLHIFYRLNVTEFANGVLGGIKTGARLSAKNCFEIGEFASRLKDNHVASEIEWLEVALKKSILDNDKSVNRIMLQERLHDAIYDHNLAVEFPGRRDDENEELFQNFLHHPDPSRGLWVDQKCKELAVDRGCRVEKQRWVKAPLEKRPDPATLAHGPLFFQTNQQKYYERLCRGEDTFQTEKEKSKLFCWLEFKVNPYFRIGPLQIEILSREPEILQFYNMIGNGTVTELGRILEGKAEEDKDGGLARAYPYNPNDPYIALTRPQRMMFSFISNYSKLPHYAAWLRTIKLSTRFDPFTEGGLEDLRSIQSTFASYVNPHHDFYTIRWPAGNRIVNFLTYLQDVVVGGLTVFPVVGVKVQPVKGSVVSWFNILGDESLENRTYHSGCPIILGRRAITAPRLFFYDQFKTYPCYKERDRLFRIFENVDERKT